MNNIISWFRSHSTAILVTAIASANLGLLPKVAGRLAQALAAVCGLSLQ